MGLVILIAEAAAVLWLAVYLSLVRQLVRTPSSSSAPSADPAGRVFVRQARLAQWVGLSLLAGYLTAASVNLAFGLGLDLPL